MEEMIKEFLSSYTINNYRPISLCNVTCKIISKLITNRLRPLLHKCISSNLSSNQAAFVPEKAIHDNILLGHEILTSFPRNDIKKKKKKNGN